MSVNNDNGGDNYEVGYKKPPQNTRWKPGQSGNPNGKKKSELSVSETLNQALKTKIVVKNSQGKKKAMTKLSILLEVVLTKAINGDMKAFAQLVPLIKTSLAQEENFKLKSAVEYLSKQSFDVTNEDVASLADYTELQAVIKQLESYNVRTEIDAGENRSDEQLRSLLPASVSSSLEAPTRTD